MQAMVHPSALVEDGVHLGKGSKIWVNVQLRKGAHIGESCNIGKDCFVDEGVHIGDGCKIQNGVSIYRGVTLSKDVFVGPNACFSNDRVPRAFNFEWKITETYVAKGASIGANATIVCGVELGEYCMVGAGAVVTKDVPAYGLVVGNPARLIAYVDRDGNRVRDVES